MPTTFPTNFVWGVSTASYQIEGAWNEDGKGENIWDRFSHTPGKVANGDTGDAACDHYHRYGEDVALMARLGVSAYRFSTSWARIQPAGKGAVNPAGLDFYRRLVHDLHQANIEPWLCLYHWDLPQKLQNGGGWANRDTVLRFGEYAEIVAKALGDGVKTWVLINEPSVFTTFGYLQGRMAPGVTDFSDFIRATHHANLAQGIGAQAIRASVKDSSIGNALSLSPAHPRSDTQADLEAADRMDQFWNRWYLDPLYRGSYPDLATPLLEVMGVEPGDLGLIKGCTDWLGVNYYSRTVVSYDPDVPLIQATPNPPPDTPKMALGLEIYPQGLEEILVRVARDYGNPRIYITENGMGRHEEMQDDRPIADAPRIAFLNASLEYLGRAIAGGADVRGYLVWSLLDNFEWDSGYAERFGLVYVDYATCTRTPKRSFDWYAGVIERNGLE
ncbi:MAG: beta-glucosidase [Herpetosiphonaceae bacterium]|nr:beta-glucosidase [Herpetosiphonaceae bacterium]